MIRRPPRSTLFPTRRSSDLFSRSIQRRFFACPFSPGSGILKYFLNIPLPGDRKSTRLNSSHTVISYAVFCLKKKKIAEEANIVVAMYSLTVPHVYYLDTRAD